jgi:carboxyl-terminal processing protease
MRAAGEASGFGRRAEQSPVDIAAVSLAMQRSRIWAAGLVAVTAACLFAGCGVSSSGGDAEVAAAAPVAADPCSVAGQRSWLRNYMSDQYFWYANLGTPDESAPDMDGYFQSLLYRPTDRYSFSQPATQFFQLLTEGTRTGYGYSLVFADASQTSLRVRFAEPFSPVGLAGLKRGDTVLSIDGYSPAQIASGTPGPVTIEGIPRSFRVVDGAGVERSFTVNSATYPISTVPNASVLFLPTPSGQVKAGYFVFQSFTANSTGALGSVFSQFASLGVSEVIVDLRYNGGGRVTVARALASMIGGGGLDGKTFAEFRFNDKHPENNFTFPFTSNAAQLPAAPLSGLNRVIVITSGSTASASELVINALKPFMNVVLIGGTTFGKPYADQPQDFCGITYSVVNFEYLNALGDGKFINGFSPNCTVPDDLDHQLGDSSEARLAAAINYIKTGICPAIATSRFAQPAGIPPEERAVFGEQAGKPLMLDVQGKR